jgi:hypothetical protein
MKAGIEASLGMSVLGSAVGQIHSRAVAGGISAFLIVDRISMTLTERRLTWWRSA